jgi:hypothetical protein
VIVTLQEAPAPTFVARTLVATAPVLGTTMTSEAEAKNGTGPQAQPSGDGTQAARGAMHAKAESFARHAREHAREIAEEAGDLGRKAARLLRKPAIGALVAGAAVLAAGAAWGASEAAVAAVAAYAVFRMLRKRVKTGEHHVAGGRKRVTPEPLSQP